MIGDIVRIQSILTFPDQYYNKCKWVAGWARSVREADKGKLCFVDLNDGSQ